MITTVVFIVEKNTFPEANIISENGWLEDNQSFFGGEAKGFFSKDGRLLVFFGRFRTFHFPGADVWRILGEVRGGWPRHLGGGKPGTWRSYIDYLDVPFINNRWIFQQSPW